MDWTSLATQIPIVAAFVWFAIDTDKRHTESQRLRDSAFLEALDRMSSRLDEIDAKNEHRLNEHDCRAILISSKVDKVLSKLSKPTTDPKHE